jgi:hypothetical protein
MTTNDDAFDKWWKSFEDVPTSIWANEHLHNLAMQAWKAAKADSAKEIADLEIQNVLYKDDELEQKIAIAELQAHINTLREALEEIARDSFVDSWQCKLAEQAISATPAESLKEVK